jgi:uncharacterized lipoprotein YddW (UPF0748 family)
LPGACSLFVRALLIALCLVAAGTAAEAQTPTPAEYRGFWVDTFNTRLNTAEDVQAVVSRAQQARANLLLVQVRRRGDAWYLNSLEPPPDGIALARDFDPLQEIIGQAHAAGVQVHAYVVVADIWHQTTLPTNPSHVFSLHGLTPVGATQPGRANWLTRTQQPDGNGTSYGGHRFGNDFWIDPGHPDAAAYTADVIARLVSSYDIDGLHLDRLQYPDFGPASAPQAPTTSTLAQPYANVGYNDTSLERYRRRYALPADYVPAADEPSWVEWRRDQVTALMRRIYLATIAAKRTLVVSAALYAGGEPPETDEGWGVSEPAARVFQDWRAWLDEGILDVAMPMVYRTEHTAAGAESFARWSTWIDGHGYGRGVAVGVGAYLNSVEGTLRQSRRGLARPTGEAAASTGPAARGVVLFSMGAHNAPVNQNPLALTQRDTPYRAFDDLASALVTGRTSSGQPLELAAVAPVFGTTAAVPVLPWKAAPTTGHLMGIVNTSTGAAADSAAITLETAGPVTSTIAAARTDGNGFYGRTALPPGDYRVVVSPLGEGSRRSVCTVTITAGAVSTLNLRIDSASPTTASCAF